MRFFKTIFVQDEGRPLYFRFRVYSSGFPRTPTYFTGAWGTPGSFQVCGVELSKSGFA